MRAVIVGASSGLGRCIGVGMARRGAQVALLARRAHRLADAAQEAGPGTVAIACDATDAASCRTAVDAARDALGGIDALVYTPALGLLRRLVDLDTDEWRRSFDTNVIGASLVTAAALPYLEASGGVAAYLSTVSASTTPPRPGLGAYAVSKAALDKLVEAWSAEHPQVGFTRIVVGACAGGDGASATEFAAGWDPQLAAEMMPIWVARNLLAPSLVDVDDLVRVVEAVVGCGASATVPTVTVIPRAPRATGS